MTEHDQAQAFWRWVGLYRALHESGKRLHEGSPEAHVVADLMDEPWKAMSPDQKDAARWILSELDRDPPCEHDFFAPPGFPGEEQCRRCSMIRGNWHYECACPAVIDGAPCVHAALDAARRERDAETVERVQAEKAERRRVAAECDLRAAQSRAYIPEPGKMTPGEYVAMAIGLEMLAARLREDAGGA